MSSMKSFTFKGDRYRYKRIGSVELQEYIQVHNTENRERHHIRNDGSFSPEKRLGVYFVERVGKPISVYGHRVIVLVKARNIRLPDDYFGNTITHASSHVKRPKELAYATTSPDAPTNYWGWGYVPTMTESKTLMHDWFSTFKEDKR